MFEHIRDYYTLLYCHMPSGKARIRVLERLNCYVGSSNHPSNAGVLRSPDVGV